MATKFFLLDEAFTAYDVDSTFDERMMRTTAGSSLATGLEDTTASGNHILIAEGDKVQKLVWMSPKLNAVTISGTVTFNFWMSESNMSANVQAACQVQAVGGDSFTFVADVVTNANANHADGVELAVTTRAAHNWTATPTSASVTQGSRLYIQVHGDGIGSMASGHTFNIGYNGATGGADGDSWVQFTENITEETGTPTSYPAYHRQRGRIIR